MENGDAWPDAQVTLSDWRWSSQHVTDLRLLEHVCIMYTAAEVCAPLCHGRCAMAARASQVLFIAVCNFIGEGLPVDPHGRLGRGLTSKQHHHQAPLCFVVYDTRMCLRKGQLNHVFVVFTAL